MAASLGETTSTDTEDVGGASSVEAARAPARAAAVLRADGGKSAPPEGLTTKPGDIQGTGAVRPSNLGIVDYSMLLIYFFNFWQSLCCASFVRGV